MKLALLPFLVLCLGFVSSAASRDVSSRPAVVKIGAIFAFNSTIGSAAKVAINAALDDVNADSSVLRGTNLTIEMQDSSCNGFLGVIEGTPHLLQPSICFSSNHSIHQIAQCFDFAHT